MSDPSRKMDVEDVLSSIRRLVSEQARVGDVPPTPSASAGTDATSEPASDDAGTAADALPDSEEDKLVLTDALRISGSDPSNNADDIAAAASRLAQRISDIDLISKGETPHANPAKASGPGGEDGATEEAGSQAATDGEEVADDLTQAVGDVVDDIVVELPQDAEEPAAKAAEDAPEEPLQTASPIKMPGGATLQSGKELQAQDDDAQAVDAPDAAPLDPDLDEDPDAIGIADETAEIMDEDALRDMVAQMVRTELQGELGDRITRNVRKMVRREIQRALSARELD